MRRFTEELIDEVWRDFKVYLNGAESLCALRGLNYAGGAVPDYNLAEVRQLYLLRYMPAYLVEYYTMYEKMLALNFLQLPLRVLSIGVGSGLDFYALHHVLRDRKLWPLGLSSFVGIDRVNWDYIYTYGHRGFIIKQADILQLDTLCVADTNVIIFPKSIGEVDDLTFHYLLNLLQGSELRSHLVILNSVRERSRCFDESRALEIVTTLCDAHDYQLVSDSQAVTHERMGFGSFSRDFCYPTELREFVTSLSSWCQMRGQENACETCDDYLNRWPILRTDHMAYQVLCLYR